MPKNMRRLAARELDDGGSLMSLLVNNDGSPKTYVVVDPRAQTILAGYGWMGEAMKGLADLRKDSAAELTIYNLTHPKCPDWLKDLFRSDEAYCVSMAERCDARASALYRKAEEYDKQAEYYERRAAEWRGQSASESAPSGPEI